MSMKSFPQKCFVVDKQPPLFLNGPQEMSFYFYHLSLTLYHTRLLLLGLEKIPV